MPVGLWDDSTTVSGTVKLFPDSKKRTLAWRRAVILPEIRHAQRRRLG